jgi:hypothetical protein
MGPLIGVETGAVVLTEIVIVVAPIHPFASVPVTV